MRRLLLAVVFACTLGCSSSQTTDVGSNTNWLRCSDAQACPGSLSCVCGYCARPCETESSDCQELAEAATCEASADVALSCSDTPPPATRVCSLRCQDDTDCGSAEPSLACQAGYCVPRTEASVTALPLEAAVTADNAYGFGYGSETSLRGYFGAVSATLAEDIFHCERGPESYTVPADALEAGDFLYLVAWSDAATTQGILAQFRRGQSVLYTGQGDWSVCATGQSYTPSSGGPERAEVERQLALCNARSTDPVTTSGGWVDATGSAAGALAVGEDNTTGREATVLAPGNEFPVVCGIDGEARWMWFNWDPSVIRLPDQTPFVWPIGSTAEENPTKQFLLFRVRAP